MSEPASTDEALASLSADWTGLDLVDLATVDSVTVTIDVHEAKTYLSRILERVAAGERIVISRSGTPIADLVPHVATSVVFGGLRVS